MAFYCRSLAVLTLLLAIAFVPGCGRKTALVPPQKLVPLAVNDLSYSLEGNRVRLEWSYPVKMENGEELQAIEAFEVLRAGIPEEDYCEGCPIRFNRQVAVDGGPLPPEGGTRTAFFDEAGLQAGYRYLYKVRSRAGWWYPSKDSNIVSFVWRVPPMAPGNIRIGSGDRQLSLSWDPVRENIDGNPLEKAPMYQVFRKSGDGSYAALGKPVQEAEFIDSGLKNETSYSYRVQTIAAYVDSLQRSEFSREISGLPRDLQPPDQPGNLVAVAISEGVKLLWQAVLNDDLAGYKVYRRGGQAAEPELIAVIDSGRNQYIDRTAAAGMKWYYSITAFDQMQPPNESIPSLESAIEF